MTKKEKIASIFLIISMSLLIISSLYTTVKICLDKGFNIQYFAKRIIR